MAQYVKGQTGNPGGRPKVVREAIDAFRNAGDLAKLRIRLVEIAMTGKHSDAIAAIKEYHDRALGKAPQAITGEDGGALQLGVIVLPMEKDG